jgi:predicted phage-related endonuclease
MSKPYVVHASVSDGTYHELHKGRLGSGAAPAALGASPYRSPVGLWAEMTGRAEPDEAENEYMWMGRALEEPIGHRVLAEHGWSGHHPMQVLRSVRWPWMLATPDWWITSGPYEGWPMEVKVTGPRSAHRWDEGPPIDVGVQAYHQIAVCGSPGVLTVVLVVGQAPRLYPVFASGKVEDWLVAQERAFIEKVRSGTMPDVDDSEACKDALKAIYPEDDGTDVHVGPEFEAWQEERETLKREAKVLETRIRGVESRMHAAIGDATFAHGPSGLIVRSKKISVKASTIERAAYSYRELRPVKGCG